MGSGKLAMVSRIRFRHKREIPEKGCGPTERTVNLFQGLTAGGGGGGVVIDSELLGCCTCFH